MGEMYVVCSNVITQNLCGKIWGLGGGNHRMVHLDKTYSEDLLNMVLEW